MESVKSIVGTISADQVQRVLLCIVFFVAAVIISQEPTADLAPLLYGVSSSAPLLLALDAGVEYSTISRVIIDLNVQHLPTDESATLSMDLIAASKGSGPSPPSFQPQVYGSWAVGVGSTDFSVRASGTI